MIPLSECVKHAIYRVHARNFSVAVFNGQTGFVGLRTKFGDRFLFTEEHWDTDESFGTVKPIEWIATLTPWATWSGERLMDLERQEWLHPILLSLRTSTPNQ